MRTVLQVSPPSSTLVYSSSPCHLSAVKHACMQASTQKSLIVWHSAILQYPTCPGCHHLRVSPQRLWAPENAQLPMFGLYTSLHSAPAEKAELPSGCVAEDSVRQDLTQDAMPDSVTLLPILYALLLTGIMMDTLPGSEAQSSQQVCLVKLQAQNAPKTAMACEHSMCWDLHTEHASDFSVLADLTQRPDVALLLLPALSELSTIGLGGLLPPEPPPEYIAVPQLWMIEVRLDLRLHRMALPATHKQGMHAITFPFPKYAQLRKLN